MQHSEHSLKQQEVVSWISESYFESLMAQSKCPKRPLQPANCWGEVLVGVAKRDRNAGKEKEWKEDTVVNYFGSKDCWGHRYKTESLNGRASMKDEGERKRSRKTERENNWTEGTANCGLILTSSRIFLREMILCDTVAAQGAERRAAACRVSQAVSHPGLLWW